MWPFFRDSFCSPANFPLDIDNSPFFLWHQPVNSHSPADRLPCTSPFALPLSFDFISTMADPFAPRSMKRKNVKGLALTPAAPKPPPTAETAGGRGDDQSAQLEIGIEYNLDLRPSDLEFIKELGSGNGGTVSKVRHIVTNTTMARKVRFPFSPPPPFFLQVSVHVWCQCCC